MKHTRVVSTKCTPSFACRAFSDTTLVCFIVNDHTTKCSRYNHWWDSSFIFVYMCVPEMTSRHARKHAKLPSMHERKTSTNLFWQVKFVCFHLISATSIDKTTQLLMDNRQDLHFDNEYKFFAIKRFQLKLVRSFPGFQYHSVYRRLTPHMSQNHSALL